jgi:Family of unknown function (DUF5343)
MATVRKKADTEPRFPYTTTPAALRRLLKEIPGRPRPGKLTLDTLKTWKVTSSNDATPLAVLKKLGLLGPGGEPLQPYVEYMQPPPVGPRALGARVKEQYRSLFETSHEPHKNTSELKTFFNIHGGGSERAIDLQIQTFKALSEFADFAGGTEVGAAGSGLDTTGTGSLGGGGGAGIFPPVKIDLHIHLPENKTARDYEAIIQDIAKYIYGRGSPERG